MKYLAGKHIVIQHIAMFGEPVVSPATYGCTENYICIRKPAMTDTQRTARLQVDTEHVSHRCNRRTDRLLHRCAG